MQLTYILGNGFDIAVGLATGYTCFYKWYKDQENESDEISLLKKTIKEEIDKGNDNWKDFEYALGQFTNVVKDKEKFIACFQNGRESLIEYIRGVYSAAKTENEDFLKSATYRLVDRSQNSDSDLADEYKMLFSTPKETEIIFNCISFNYTPILEEGREELISNAQGFSNAYNRPSKYDIGDVLNVHGTLNDYPILGVDNIMQIANEDFREDEEIVQMMVKGEVDKKLGRNWRKDAVSIIDKSDKIYIYGASLGDSDQFWWRTIAQWFEADEKHELALYCHPNENMSERIPSFLDSISKHFNDKNLRTRIAIDSVQKNMTVKFAHLSGQAQIQFMSSVRVDVIDTKELKKYTGGPL